MTRNEWEMQARERGVDAVHFVAPRKWLFQGSDKPRNLCGDPFAFFPGATCMIALIRGYRPFGSRSDGGPPLSAFYFTSHALYQISRELETWSAEQGARVTLAELPAKGMLAQTGIARICRSSLATTEDWGTRFAVRWMLTDAFEPDPDPVLGGEYHCDSCERCVKACPVQAISDTLNTARCVRRQMSGKPMPDWAKEKMPTLVGCEICQQVCPHNAAISKTDTPDDLAALFTYERLIPISSDDKKQYADRLGPNAITRSRLTAQALTLAARHGNDAFVDVARGLQEDGTDCVRDAAAWYLSRIKP